MMALVMDRSLGMFTPGQELLKRMHSGQGQGWCFSVVTVLGVRYLGRTMWNL